MARLARLALPVAHRAESEIGGVRTKVELELLITAPGRLEKKVTRSQYTPSHSSYFSFQLYLISTCHVYCFTGYDVILTEKQALQACSHRSERQLFSRVFDIDFALRKELQERKQRCAISSQPRGCENLNLLISARILHHVCCSCLLVFITLVARGWSTFSL